MHSGSCLCGAVKYQIDAPITAATHCHCSMCRKAHGAAFATYARVRKSDFRYTQGAEQVRVFHSSPGAARTFCQVCGANLQWLEFDSEFADVTLGTLDTPLGEIPQKHIYADSKADWYAIRDGLPQENG